MRDLLDIVEVGTLRADTKVVKNGIAFLIDKLSRLTLLRQSLLDGIQVFIA